MTSRYPIARHHKLRRFLWWNTVRRRRRPLTAGRDETLVYEIGSEYVTGGVDPVRADAVSVVDVRRGVRLEVFHLRQYRGPQFEQLFVLVTAVFHCTVVDPVAVAETRHTTAIQDMYGFLTERLSAAPDVQEPGGEEVLRQALTTWLEPSPIPGVHVVLAGLTVASRGPDLWTGTDDEDYTEA